MSSPMRIIIKHYVPNMISILLLDASTAIPNFIFTEAGLSFLGIGLTAPEISLGVLISQGTAEYGLLSIPACLSLRCPLRHRYGLQPFRRWSA